MQTNYTSPTFDFPKLTNSIGRSQAICLLSRVLIVSFMLMGFNFISNRILSRVFFAAATGSALVGKISAKELGDSDRTKKDVEGIGVGARNKRIYESMASKNHGANSPIISAEDPAASFALEQYLSPEQAAALSGEGGPEVPIYDLSDIAGENHTAVVGESGSGKSFLTQWLISENFPPGSSIIALDTDAAPSDWPGLKVVGRGCNTNAIEGQMSADLSELQRRTELKAKGSKVGVELVRIIEEFPTVAAIVEEEMKERNVIAKSEGEPLESGNVANKWLKAMLRRGRKYKMKVVLVSQEFEVKSLGISGEGSLRKAFSVIYLGATAFAQLDKIRDSDLRERLREWLKSQSRPALVESKGQWFACVIPEIEPTEVINDQPIEPESFTVSEPTTYSNASAYGGASTTVELGDLSGDRGKSLHKLIKELLAEGKTKTQVFTLLGFVGSQWDKGKALWNGLEAEYGSFD